MRLIFSLLSIAYVAGIFLFADSSVVPYLNTFNPYSLLHIPLYGILTTLIILSFFPLKSKRSMPGVHNLPVLPYVPDKSAAIGIDRSARFRFLISVSIALIVAIADEVHQSFIMARDASIIDVFLDFVGIVLALFMILQLHKKLKARSPFCRTSE